MPTNLSADERALLQRLRSLSSNTLVRLRAALSWDVARFATAVVALQESGLLTRDGIHLAVTAEGANQLQQASRERTVMHSTPFSEQSKAPRLPVASLYLPDHGRFLRAMHRSLYTHDVSRTDPE